VSGPEREANWLLIDADWVEMFLTIKGVIMINITGLIFFFLLLHAVLRTFEEGLGQRVLQSHGPVLRSLRLNYFNPFAGFWSDLGCHWLLNFDGLCWLCWGC